MAVEAAAGVVLLVFTVAAIGLANSPWSGPFEAVWQTPLGFRVGEWDFARAGRAWVNDGFMTFFFFLVSLELKREFVLGELRNPRTATLSIAAAIGGMVVPAVLYLVVESGQAGERGWGTVMATDTAFVIGCLAVLGARVPQSLRVFMLSLAIIDDIGAIIVVALGYSQDIAWAPLALALLGMAGVSLMGRLGFRAFPVYFFVGGLIWLAVDASGIHATVTGVVLGLMTPARRWVDDRRLYAILSAVVVHPERDLHSGATRNRDSLQLAEVAARESLSPVERLEIALHPWVGFVIMPLFALANAGVTFSPTDFDRSIMTGIVIGFTVGKPAGILFFAWLAVRLGVAERPPGLAWMALTGGGLLAGIGFTMALFIGQLAFDEQTIASAKLAILLASVCSATAGLALLMRNARRARADR